MNKNRIYNKMDIDLILESFKYGNLEIFFTQPEIRKIDLRILNLNLHTLKNDSHWPWRIYINLKYVCDSLEVYMGVVENDCIKLLEFLEKNIIIFESYFKLTSLNFSPIPSNNKELFVFLISYLSNLMIERLMSKAI